MKNDLIYAFCISDTPYRKQADIDSCELKSLEFDNFSVIIKYVPDSEFSEDNLKRNLSNLQWIETKAIEHVSVINQIMEYSTVIPFKFGTIYNTEQGLKKFITDYSSSISGNFHLISGREEWAVKIYCDRKKLCEKIDDLSKDVADLEKQIMASSPGKAYLLKRKKSDLVDNEMDRLCKNYGQSYFDSFKTLSEATNLINLIPKEFTGRDETMILNAAFLIQKNNIKAFLTTAETLAKEDGNSGFLIETTGPWPPFSFISIKE